MTNYRSPDPVDEANDLAAALADTAVHAIRKAATTRETHPDFDGETCVECGDDMPKERLAAGRIRCVPCQTAIELRNKQHGVFGAWPSQN